MKTSESEFQMWMGFDICLEFLRPLRLEFWKGSDFSNFKPEAPFRYHADALIGLSLFLMHPSWKGPHLPPHTSKIPEGLWKGMEPHHELYLRSHERAEALQGKGKKVDLRPFEKQLTDLVHSSLHPWGMDLTDLHEIPALIDSLEDKMGRPLLYNFDLEFKPEVVRGFHLLHSLLFNLRTLLAMDYNAYIKDPTHEALKVDSIADYLARGEYIVNDALLYLQFSKMKEKVPAKIAAQLEQSFMNYSHNGTCLVQSLPSSFLKGMQPELLEESLYLVQMDWLLGSEAGLLYRIREELYGLIEGYNQIFWPDVQVKSGKRGEKLSIQCELTDKSLRSKPAVA